MFNNREIATVIWLALLSIWVLAEPSVRNSIANLFRAFLHWKILTCIAGMILYSAAIVSVLYAVEFWQPAMVKGTVLWFCFTAFAMVMRFTTSHDNENIFRQVFFDNVKMIILVEFLIGAYVMSLPVELLFVPLVTLLTMLDAVARLDKEHAPVVKLTGFSLAVIGFAILWIAISRAIGDYRNIGTMDTFRSIAFPPLMSILLVPFIYGVVIISTYESIFLRLQIGQDKTADLVRYAKWRIICHHGFSLRRLRDFAKRPPFETMQIQSTDDVDRLLDSV